MNIGKGLAIFIQHTTRDNGVRLHTYGDLLQCLSWRKRQWRTWPGRIGGSVIRPNEPGAVRRDPVGTGRGIAHGELSRRIRHRGIRRIAANYGHQHEVRAFQRFSGSRAYHRPFNAAGRLRLLGLTGRSGTSGHRWMREQKSRSKGAAAFTSTRATGDLSVCAGKRQQRDKQ